MLNFIIYEKDEMKKSFYCKIIKSFLFENFESYRIHEFDVYNQETRQKLRSIAGLKIFIINTDNVNDEGLKIAKYIRKCGDFISPIILLTTKDKTSIINKINNILFIDLIKVDQHIVKQLMRNLKEAYKIVIGRAVYTFSIFDEVYRIPYEDINFIEKNLNDDSITIVTKEDTYLNYSSIKTVEKILSNDIRFYKSHRSCILNLFNVSSYDKKNNIIVFKDGTKIDLIAKNKKTELAKLLRELNDENCLT